MAVKTACPFCKKGFSAPDEYRGKKVECPRCGRRSVLRTHEDLKEEAELAAVDQQRQAADREKLALMERVSSSRQKKAGRPYYEEFQTGLGGVRHYNPRAPSRFLRFRALSGLLLLGAYVEVLLVAIGMGLTVYAWHSGLVASLLVLLLCLVAWLVGGTANLLAVEVLWRACFSTGGRRGPAKRPCAASPRPPRKHR